MNVGNIIVNIHFNTMFIIFNEVNGILISVRTRNLNNLHFVSSAALFALMGVHIFFGASKFRSLLLCLYLAGIGGCIQFEGSSC